MIKEILNQSSCANCRMCCIFDRYDIWETPVFDAETMKKTLEINPESKFAAVSGGYVINAGEIADGELFRCPALTDKGCALGDDKPFDCRIWPFRVMNHQGSRVIAVSSLCEEVHSQDHQALKSFLEKGLADTIFRYADQNPQIIKPFYGNYTVLMTDKSR
ncbi:MAG: hypothetical protein NC093_01925 [Alistipes sp.]|nr:hypothetical protein [Alistipes sp.]